MGTVHTVYIIIFHFNLIALGWLLCGVSRWGDSAGSGWLGIGLWFDVGINYTTYLVKSFTTNHFLPPQMAWLTHSYPC